jgi:hypothetical protein
MSFIAKAINVGEYVLVKHEGHFTREEFEEGRSIVKKQLTHHQWKKLLVDMRGVANHTSLADIYYIMESNTRVLPNIKIGLVFPPERQADGKFAEHVATNRGSNLKSFIDYNQAIAWLTED